MRPAETRKSTAAAPTPISDGARLPPWALSPWQLAQLLVNSARPAATSALSLGEAEPRGARAPYSSVSRPRQATTTAMPAVRRPTRRRASVDGDTITLPLADEV